MSASRPLISEGDQIADIAAGLKRANVGHQLDPVEPFIGCHDSRIRWQSKSDSSTNRPRGTPLMRSTRRTFACATLAASFAACFGTILPIDAQALSPVEAQEIAEDAYIYGYSLITTEVTRVQTSNVPKAESLRAPSNQFVNVPRYPPADYRGVSAPNADTLYSIASIDLAEPIVFSHTRHG
jgi:Protein of unknown function (DUF1254)